MDLEAIEKRTNAATQGPWTLEKVGDFHDPGWMIADVIRDPKGANALDFGTDKALGEFVKHARTDVPALVARVRELEESNRKLSQQASLWEGHVDRLEASGHKTRESRDQERMKVAERVRELEGENQRLRDTAAVARYVADHWREAAVTNGWKVASHPLCLVLAALNGETEPEQLGLNEEDRGALDWARDIAQEDT